jgi:hypothetical protein
VRERPDPAPHWCTWCLRWCPGADAETGYCLLGDRAEIDARARWLRTGEAPAVVVAAPGEPLETVPVAKVRGRRKRGAPVEQMALTWE